MLIAYHKINLIMWKGLEKYHFSQIIIERGSNKLEGQLILMLCYGLHIFS